MFSLLATLTCASTFAGAAARDQSNLLLAEFADDPGESTSILQAVAKVCVCVWGGGVKGTASAGTLRVSALQQRLCSRTVAILARGVRTRP